MEIAAMSSLSPFSKNPCARIQLEGFRFFAPLVERSLKHQFCLILSLGMKNRGIIGCQIEVK